MTSEDELVAHVAAHAGNHADLDAVRAATHATLSVVGAYATPAIRGLVADELAPSLGVIVERGEAGTALPIEEHVLTPDMTVARAEELIASVLAVLAEELSDDTRTRLARQLPEALAQRLVPPSSACPHTARIPASERRADRTQHDSVAAANPHGDAKLSSGHTREHDTLAGGRPGSKRSLANTRK